MQVTGTLDDISPEPATYHKSKPNLNQWTKVEDDLLSSLVEKHGLDWSEISLHLPNKKITAIRKRYFAKHDPSVKRTKWTPEED